MSMQPGGELGSRPIPGEPPARADDDRSAQAAVADMRRVLARRNRRLLLVAVGAAGLILFNIGLTHWLTRQVDRSAAALAQRWAGDDLPAPTPGYWRVQHLAALPPADDANVAHHLYLATQALPGVSRAERDALDGAQSPYRMLPLREDLPEDLLELARAISQREAQARAHVRTAREGTYVDWAAPEMAIATMLPMLSEQRRLAMQIYGAAAVAFEDGDIGEVLELVQDLLMISGSMADYGPSLVSALVALAIEGLATGIVSDLLLHGPQREGTELAESLAAERERVERLIALLLDDGRHSRRMAMAFRGEAVMHWHLQEALAHDPDAAADEIGPIGAEARVVIPVLRASLLASAQAVDGITAAEGMDFHVHPAHAGMPMPRLFTLEAGPVLIVQLLPTVMMPAVDRSVFISHRHALEHRVAAIMLAMALYEADHGAPPPDLEALVPGYLPYVPLDPLDPQQGTLRYRTDTPLPFIYSVGENGIDQGGDVTPGRAARPHSFWDRPDFVFPLALPPDPDADPYAYLEAADALDEPEGP